MTSEDIKLSNSILERDQEALAAAIRQGANPNFVFQGNPWRTKSEDDSLKAFPAITWAIARHFVEGIDLLLHAGANLNVVDDEGKTALTHLTTDGSYWDLWCDYNESPHQHRSDLIRKFKLHGADFNHRDHDGHMPIWYALQGLGGVIDIDEYSEEFLEWIGVLIDNGADINARDHFGNPAVLDLPEFSKLFLEFALDRGFDINARLSSGTLLGKIASSPPNSNSDRRIECLMFLLKRNADPNIADVDGIFPLDHLYRDSDYFNAIALINQGAIETQYYQRRAAIDHRFTKSFNDARKILARCKKSGFCDSETLNDAAEQVSNALDVVLENSPKSETEEYLVDSLLTLFDLYALSGNHEKLLELFSLYKDSQMEAEHGNVSFWMRNAAITLYRGDNLIGAINAFRALVRHVKHGINNNLFDQETLWRYCLVEWQSAKTSADLHLNHLIDSAVRRYPNYARLRSLKGRILLDCDRLIEAEIELREAVELDTDGMTGARGNLAEAYFKQDLLDEAEEIAREDVRFQAKNPHKWSYLAQILISKGEPDDAELCIDRALEIDPVCKSALKAKDRLNRLRG